MKITSIIENTSKCGLPVEHGLSLYIKLNNGRNILFDMGQRCLFAENAERLGLNIAEVDTAFISHGHYDHGGGLRAFLELNEKANVYIHKDAFFPHYSLRDNGLAYIGLDVELRTNKRLMFTSEEEKIADEMTLFADVEGMCCCPCGNRLLFESTDNGGMDEVKNDMFTHEQNLIIEEDDKVVLIAGCAHKGIVNIMRKAEAVCGKTPTHVLAGMHLVKSGLNEEDENAFIATLAQELMKYKDCKFYTMHCTGIEQFDKLKSIMESHIEYLSCGEDVTI